MVEIAFLCYVVATIFIGFIAWKNTKSIEEYLLGGRSLSSITAGLSAGASDMSGWILLGLPGLAIIDPGLAIWTAVGLAVGTWVNWKLLAARLRRASIATRALTIPGLLAGRFPRHGDTLSLLTSLMIVLLFLLYTSAGLVAGAKLFSSVFSVSYATSVFLTAGLITLYTILGGFLAVSWTDAFQSCLILIGLSLVLCSAITDFELDRLNSIPSVDKDVIASVAALSWGIGYLGQPHILARFMAIRSESALKNARRIGVGWTIGVLFLAVSVGLIGAQVIVVGQDSERIFLILISQYLPSVLAGICLAAILAAIMSTADSQLLTAASAFTEDLVPLIYKQSLSQRQKLFIGRGAVLMICFVATSISLEPDAKVFYLVAKAWAGFGATFAPVLLIALYQEKASGLGALLGLITGAVIVAIWPYLPDAGFGIYELLPGFLGAFFINYLANRIFSPERPPSCWE